MKRRAFLGGLSTLACVRQASAAARSGFELVWPTPHPGWRERRPPAEWLQHAGSGDSATGGFGGVRSGGSRFHEGIDIQALGRDRQGNATDPVFAAMAGVVRHVSANAGNSSYGRYVVVEHPLREPAVYTLYAHLAQIALEVRPGAEVRAGQTLGIMGHSSGGYRIPPARAHLHFEIGLAVTRDFEAWYQRRRLGGRNEHGMWNGMNLIGVDFDEWRDGRVAEPRDFLARLPVAVRFRVASFRRPDFVERYPSLVRQPQALGPGAGWEIRCHWTGLPFAWAPLTAAEATGLPAKQPVFLEVDPALGREQRSRILAVPWRGGWKAGKDLETVLKQLFAWG
jgi:murein DD-endopeptidase MepM/ murein hydrolase activator NlpD